MVKASHALTILGAKKGGKKDSATSLALRKADKNRKAKAAASFRRGHTLTLKDQRSSILKNMKRNPKIMPKIIEYLESINEWFEDDSSDEENNQDEEEADDQPCGLEGEKKGDAKDMPDVDVGGVADAGLVTPAKKNQKALVVNKNATTVMRSPLSSLKRWLAMVEEISLSEGNLKHLVQRGQRDASKTSLAELFEFVFDIERDEALFLEGKDAGGLKQFEARLQRLNLQKGRRAKDIIIAKLDWETDGFYQLEQNEKRQHIVVQRFSLATAVLPEIYQSQPFCSLRVTSNYSLFRAKLEVMDEKAGIEDINVVLLLPPSLRSEEDLTAITPPPLVHDRVGSESLAAAVKGIDEKAEKLHGDLSLDINNIKRIAQNIEERAFKPVLPVVAAAQV